MFLLSPEKLLPSLIQNNKRIDFSLQVKRQWCDGKIYLDEASVLKYLVGITNELELLHYSHRLIQIQDDSCGCDAEISLQRKIGV